MVKQSSMYLAYEFFIFILMLFNFIFFHNSCFELKRIQKNYWTFEDAGFLLRILDERHNSPHPRSQLIPSRYFVDQRVLQSDWTKDTAGYIQPKVVVSDAAFP